MGYNKMFNLVTIQLIIPLLTMTKAEYKNAYGIDLDNIDFEKVTLLQEDGSKNKYFVDEIKIVSDDVLIFAGGKILNIGGDGNVSVTSNAYSVENSKPIYWHTISFQRGGTAETATSYRIFGQMIILNNTPTPITLNAFSQMLKTPGFFAVVYNGKYSSTPAENLQGMTMDCIGFEYLSNSEFNVVYRDSNNVIVKSAIGTELVGFAVFEDLGANKIN